jgi:putative membrane protein
MHQELLDAIETEFLPNAKNAEVKQLLEQTRTKVTDHLEEARQLQQQLSSAPAG